MNSFNLNSSLRSTSFRTVLARSSLTAFLMAPFISDAGHSFISSVSFFCPIYLRPVSFRIVEIGTLNPCSRLYYFIFFDLSDLKKSGGRAGPNMRLRPRYLLVLTRPFEIIFESDMIGFVSFGGFSGFTTTNPGGSSGPYFGGLSFLFFLS